ncbi:MAG: hypothetical protein EOO32_04855 [Comamonadaceae bacterium]|nr:MAG: hypothetical protein EOO32_04855 [Comamonadaceae bacterium]
MSTPTAQPTADTEEYSLPCAEALLAGTLALMTGFAQACDAQHRDAMGRKIAANLQNLSQLESLTPHFRTMLWNLQARWAQPHAMQAPAVGQGDAAAPERVPRTPTEQRRALWHSAPDVLQ